MSHTFRHCAGFGKRMEYWVIGRMLKEGLDVYVPLVDDQAVDAVVCRGDGSFVSVQIKARSNEVQWGHAGLFAAIPHEEVRKNYWFVFYSERMNKTWVMTSAEFVKEAKQNKGGKNVGKRTICLNGKRRRKDGTGNEEYCLPRFEKYLDEHFSRITPE